MTWCKYCSGTQCIAMRCSASELQRATLARSSKGKVIHVGRGGCLPACLPASQGKGSGWWRYEWWAVWFPSRMVWTHFDGFPNAVQPSIHWNISLDYSFNVPNYTIHSETFSMVIQLHWTAIFNKLALNYSFLMHLQVFDCSDHSEEGIR